MKKSLILSLLLALLVATNALGVQSRGYSGLTFRSLEGASVNLGDLQGRVTVVSFSAKGIPLVGTELSQLQRLATKFGNQGLVVIWVSTNSTNPKSSDFASDADLRSLANQYPRIKIVRDPEESSFRQIGADTLPTILVLNQKGQPVGNPHVGIDPQADLVNKLSNTVNTLLAQ